MAKRRRFSRPSGFRDRKKLFVIATEGAKTEEIYFDSLRPRRDAVVRMEVLPSRTHKSDPKNVLKRLRGFKQKNDITSTDELWLVIDRDTWPCKMLDKIAAECDRNGFQLAVSNPCFELWLYLHLSTPRPFSTADECTSALSSKMAYDKAGYDADSLHVGIPDALQRAQQMDDEEHHPWPRTNGTRVYLLVQRLLSDSGKINLHTPG